MAKRTRYGEYHDRYPNYRLELSDDGILLMQCHKLRQPSLYNGLM
jgi:hypothetical protein